MEYEAVIGLEVHAQLLTESKIFSASSTAYGGAPNSQTDPVVLGLPGVLPVLNRRAVAFAIRMGLATHCRITHVTHFARKQYFYPDLPKGYQISQFDDPLCQEGYVEITGGEGQLRRIGLTRIHLEEDAGKLVHDTSHGGADSFIDLNRSGVPLIEIVSEPDLRSAAEAFAYLQKLKQLLTYLDICDGNMEEGSLRCDANVSIRPPGASEYGTKTELKNLNSFRNVERAINYEIDRQTRLLEGGQRIVQETLLWDESSNSARTMRSKEEAHDYRYFPEPDLVPLQISDEQIAQIREELPELPEARRQRFESQYQLPPYDADILTITRQLADYYEAVAQEAKDTKLASNWVMSDVLRILKEQKISIESFPIPPVRLSELINLISDKTISANIAKNVLEEMLSSGKAAAAIVGEKGLAQISDVSRLETIVDRIIAENPQQVSDYRAGKHKLLSFFIGQTMRHTGGKANPGVVNQLLKQKLGG